MNRLRIVSVLTFFLLVGVFSASSGFAGGHSGEPFSEARFRALQAEDALVLVDVSATWCSTCARQARLLERFRETHPDVPLHVLRVDFDDQKEWVRYFRAPRQSTLVLFRGDEQVWFAVAETREKVLFSKLAQAAAKG